MRKPYQSDLSDAEWYCLELHLPVPEAHGRPRLHTLREILDAVFYVVRGGCAWRLLPHDFPPWKTVYHYFRFWRLDGTWERMHSALRKRVRVRINRDPEPSAGVVDSQSVKSTAVGGEQRGYDGAKKVKGSLSATSWWTPRVSYSRPRSTAPRCWTKRGIKPLLRRANEQFPRLSHLWLDAGYRGEDKRADWVQKTLGWSVDLVERPKKPAPEEVLMKWAKEWAKEGVAVDWQKLMPPKGFQVLPRRWVVERTLAWIEQNRRMSKDYERLCASGEALVYAAMIRLMTRRLARV